VKAVLVAAQQINQLDSTGADQLAKLAVELEAKGIGLAFAEVKGGVRSMMHRTSLEETVGADHLYESIEAGVQGCL